MSDNDREIFDRLRGVESQMKETFARCDALIEQNKELIQLLKVALRYGFFIILALLASLIYGAIGAKGFNAVTRPLAGEVAP